VTTTTTTTGRTRAQRSEHPPMDPMRRTAYVVGVLFLVTYVTSIAAKFSLYAPFLDNPDYLLGDGEDTRVLWGAFAEMILVLANIGTAVALYPVLRRRFPALSLGFVTARVMESVFIAVGILAVVTLVTMRQDFAGAAAGDGTTLAATSHALVALQEWTFNLGPGVVVGVGNGLILGYMMYRTGLVPRGLAMLGLAAGPLLVLSGTAVLFGVTDAGSTVKAVASLPEFFWELIFGLYLIVKGFKPSAVTPDMVDPR
jgi:hypothetical protein